MKRAWLGSRPLSCNTCRYWPKWKTGSVIAILTQRLNCPATRILSLINSYEPERALNSSSDLVWQFLRNDRNNGFSYRIGHMVQSCLEIRSPVIYLRVDNVVVYWSFAGWSVGVATLTLVYIILLKLLYTLIRRLVGVTGGVITWKYDDICWKIDSLPVEIYSLIGINMYCWKEVSTALYSECSL